MTDQAQNSADADFTSRRKALIEQSLPDLYPDGDGE